MNSVTAIGGRRQLRTIEDAMAKNFERLSTGKRVNHASDDAAVMGMVKKLEAELASVNQASRNADFGVSASAIAEGALASQSGIVSRMRELAMQSANGTLADADRTAIDTEYQQLGQELDRIAATTEFNGQPLLTGNSMEIQVGTGGDAANRVSLAMPTSDTATLGIAGLSLATAGGAAAALSSLDGAVEAISTSRASLGAGTGSLLSAQDNLASSYEAGAASLSRMRDTDVAQEASDLQLNELRHRFGVAAYSRGQQSRASLYHGLL